MQYAVIEDPVDVAYVYTHVFRVHVRQHRDQSTCFIISRVFDQRVPSWLSRANNNREAGNLQSSNRQSLLNTVGGCFDSKHSNTELLWSRGYLTSERLQSRLKCLLMSAKARGRRGTAGKRGSVEREKYRTNVKKREEGRIQIQINLISARNETTSANDDCYSSRDGT